MGPTILRLREYRVEYSTYYGFDSFEGLPPEAERFLANTSDSWAPGALKLTHAFNPAYRDVKVGSKTDPKHVYVPINKDAKPFTKAEAVEAVGRSLNSTQNRVLLVPGYTSLSPRSLGGTRRPPCMWI